MKPEITGDDVTFITASVFQKVIDVVFLLLHASITSAVYIYRETRISFYVEVVMEITIFKHVVKSVALRERKLWE